MGRISPGTRQILRIMLVLFLVFGLYVTVAIGILHIPLTWGTIIAQGLGVISAGLLLLARTRLRLYNAIWASVWALVVAGLILIVEASISGSIYNLKISAETAILPLLAALVTWAAAYWWYRRHL
jgi:hypothetical protein